MTWPSRSRPRSPTPKASNPLRWRAPGFINITLDSASAAAVVDKVLSEGAAFGRNGHLGGETLNLEFVSANPTGPIHIGGTRWAAVGDSMARVLEANGATVVREYYFNDHGEQINRFAKSLVGRRSWRGVPGRRVQGRVHRRDRPSCDRRGPGRRAWTC